MSISSAIQAFKTSVDSKVMTGDCATPEQLRLIQSKYRLPIPAELRDFYTDIGSLVSDDMECNGIRIESAAETIRRIEDPDRWTRLHSTGLIDFIKFSWFNDRYEFDKYLDRSFVAAINAKYQAFGLWRGHDAHEGAHYLYFDESGKFGSVYYHQDAFDAFVDGHLDAMSRDSPALGTLQDCLEKAFALIGRNILEGRHDC